MGVKERIFLFIDSMGISKNKFEKLSGLSNGYLKNFKGSLGADKLEGIMNAFPQLNREWLLNGNGQMLAATEKQFRDAKKDVIPLIPYPAIGGYTEDNWTALLNDCPLYAIPDIKTPADFLIKVGGESMQPKYYEGDLLACKVITEILFFQWGKTYVVDTSQGVMVKNVYEDKNNPDNILLVSENAEKYPPFSIPKSDIRKLALVVGSLRIRME